MFVCILGKCFGKYSILFVWSNVKQNKKKNSHPKPPESTKNGNHYCQPSKPTPQPCEAQICREAHRKNRGLMGERESREREQKESRGESRGVFLFWKMVYEKIFRKLFFNFCLMIFRSKLNVFH